LIVTSSCNPVENGLHSPAGLLNGPAAASSMPSGKNGRDRLPLARSV
jgi:hypothetical protein